MLQPVLDKAKAVQTEVMDSAHKVFLAGLGAVTVAGEESGKMWTELVEKGKTYEPGNAQLAKLAGSVKNASDKAVDAVKKVNANVQGQVSAALHRIGVPTVDEIVTLTQRVETLSAGVDKLKAKAKAEKAEAKPEAKPEKSEGKATKAHGKFEAKEAKTEKA